MRSASASLWLSLLEWAVLGAALLAFTVTEQYRPYVTLGLLLLPLAVLLRWLRTRTLSLRSGLELPLLLFLASACLATWIAVDRPVALLQLFRIFAAVVLFYAVIGSDPRLRPWLVASLLLAGVVLALYWPTQADFSAARSKFDLLTQLGLGLNSVLPSLLGPFIHPNVAAGTLAALLPFSLALACWGFRRRWLFILSLLAGLAILFTLVLTASRGAWLGVLAALALLVLVLVQRRWFATPLQLRLFWLFCLLLLLLGLLLLSLTGLLPRLLGSLPDPTGTLQSRLSLWEQGALLIGDYPYTGIGLMGFRLVYSIYGLLIHVPHHDHLHNTYLQVWLEQGFFAFFALLWGLFAAFRLAWRLLLGRHASPWAWAGLASLAILAVHGLFDVVFYLERTLPLVGFFAGMAWLAYASPLPAPARPRPSPPPWLKPSLLAAGALSLLVVLIFFGRFLLASFYANLGAISQTRLELSVYDPSHFDDPTMDELRRQLDLDPAILAYQRALRWDPSHRSASQRLAQIALSRGEYDSALLLMQRLWDAGHHDQVTRLLYADALAAAGQTRSAADLLAGLPWAALRLNGHAFYRYYRLADYDRARFAWETVLLLDPSNPSALNGLQLLPSP